MKTQTSLFKSVCFFFSLQICTQTNSSSTVLQVSTSFSIHKTNLSDSDYNFEKCSFCNHTHWLVAYAFYSYFSLNHLIGNEANKKYTINTLSYA